MRITKAYLRTFLGSRSFYKSALAVMIPVAIQQLINTLFNVADTVMVGSLGGLSMSAVAVANKPGLIYNGFFFGMTGAGGLLLSQYYGAGEKDQCQSIFSLELLLGLCSSVGFCLLLALKPYWIMTLFVKDETTIQLGVSYLKTISISYIPVAVSSTCIFSMRALGYNKMPMRVSLATILCNVILNYLFIFGKLGLPAMGVQGAALGTLLSRMMEMCIYLWVLSKKHAFFALKPLAFLKLKIPVLKSFLRRAAPLTINELLWSSGLNIFFWAYAWLDEPSLPAITIAEQAMQVGMVLSIGMASAVSVMVGRELGAGNFQEAKQNCKRLFSLVGFISILCLMVGTVLAFFLPGIFQVDVSLRTLATQLTLVYTLFFPFNAMYAFCFFCLRAGGATRSAALLDSGYMWAIPIPFSVLLALLGKGKISLLPAVFIVQFLMNSKLFLALRTVYRGRWIKNITLEG